MKEDLNPGIEKEEFVGLFRQLYKPVKNFIYYKTGDIDLAGDIAQDAFLKVWEMRNDVRTATVKPLLYTIANNLCKNSFNHQQIVFEFSNRFVCSETSASPEFEMEMKEFHLQLQQALGTLSEKNRIVFLMNRADGYTFREIAEILGLSVKAVEKRMKNALTDLKGKITQKL
ncbi:MAG: RNA polymerase sigma factor [Mangrovibacterium sp.]